MNATVAAIMSGKIYGKLVLELDLRSSAVLEDFLFISLSLITRSSSNPKNYFQYFFFIFSPSFLRGPGTSFNYARIVNVHRVETFSDSRGRVGEEFEIEESVLTEKVEYIYVYIYIHRFRCIRPCEPRRARRSLYILYRLYISRARDVRLAQQSTILSWPR